MIEASFDELKLSGALPAPAGVGLHVLRLIRDDRCSAEDLGRALAPDAALSGRLVKLASSASPRPNEPVTTILDAVGRLGAPAASRVALGLSLIGSRSSSQCQGFDYDRFWAHALLRALAAEAFARRGGACDAAECYL